MEGRVQQVGRGVVALGVDPRSLRHPAGHFGAFGQRSLHYLDAVDDETLDGFLGIEDGGVTAFPDDLTGVPDLTAGLTEERSLLEDHLAGIAGVELVLEPVITDEGDDRGLEGEPLVAVKGRRNPRVGQIFVLLAELGSEIAFP